MSLRKWIINSRRNDLTVDNIGSKRLGFLQQYGWFVVFGVALAYFLKSKIQPHLDQRRQQTESAAHHKGPDAFMAREEALQAARARMQAKHDEEVQMYAEKQKKEEEERRKAKIDGFDRYQEGKGYRSPLKSNPVQKELLSDLTSDISPHYDSLK
uniref:Selenoprotein S n=1 Tax=Capitella teleta TaxID=283909 RepID=X1ZNY5_CAPTE